MTNIIAVIFWCLTTNWQDAGQSTTAMWPPEANTTTYHERGDIYTNKCARVNVEGHEQVVTLETFSIGTAYRDYTMSKPRREYGPTTVTWSGPHNNNWGNSTNYFIAPTNIWFCTNLTNLAFTIPLGNVMSNELPESWHKKYQNQCKTNDLLMKELKAARLEIFTNAVALTNLLNKLFPQLWLQGKH